ncbi:AAA family ATPase [Tissierella sp.]|uniref:AAA family ATPase n=1 Tax=Tissierella sp. TaxID=41274 RepID=UPI00302121B5
MSKIISVWSYKDGWGSSTILSLLTKLISSETDSKILCIDMQSRYSTLSSYIGDDIKEETNIDGLLSIAEVKPIDDNILKHYIQKSSIRNVNLIAGSRISKSNSLERIVPSDKNILDNLVNKFKEKYDFIIIDLPSGVDNQTSKYFFGVSDFIISVLNQDRIHLTNLSGDINNNRINKEKLIGVLNYYDDSLSLTDSFIKKELSIKIIIALPYLSKIKETANEDILIDINDKDILDYFKPILMKIIDNFDELPKESKDKAKKSKFNIFKKLRNQI